MKKLLMFALFLPLSSHAETPNPFNNPNLPGYQNPTQQRLLTQMQTQQLQQQNMLNQQIQRQNLQQQTQLNTEINNNTQRVIQSQPGMITNQLNDNNNSDFDSFP